MRQTHRLTPRLMGTARTALIALALAFLAAGASGPARAEPAQAAVPPAATAETGDGFQLTYALYAGGLRMLTLDFDVALHETAYRTDVRLETAGLIAWLFDWHLQAESEGAWADDALTPRRHRSANVWRGSERWVEIAYAGDVASDVRADPPYGEDARRAVRPGLLPGAIDPMSAITAMILANRSGDLCRPRVAIYDGRRRYDALLTPLGRAELKPSQYAPYDGPADGCLLRFERIAGFKPGKQRLQDATADIWLAAIGAGSGMVPVRLELRTPWGDGLAHLVHARRGDGRTVFGSPENLK